jgi:zinc transport system substrate-binding protein
MLMPLFIVIFLCMVITSGCTDQDTGVSGPAPDKRVVACTIPPQEEFIREIGGDEFQVIVLVPQGSSPHTYEPVPSQISSLESADLYLYIGSGIEFENRWLDRIRTIYPDLPLVNVSENITLVAEKAHNHGDPPEIITDGETGTDPHVWLSVPNAIEMVRTTSAALADLSPEKRKKFEKNRDEYIERLNTLDQEIRRSLSDMRTKKVLVYHPAFGYFCRDYNLVQIPVEEDGKEPSAKSLASVVDLARKEQISYIMTDPAVSSRGAETIASEINATVIQVSPLAGAYLENMQMIADRIKGQS